MQNKSRVVYTDSLGEKVSKVAEYRELTIEEERAAFDDALPDLLAKHRGAFALFKHGENHGFFSTADAAFEAGIKQFGVDATFLVQEIKPDRPEPANLALQHGVMVG